MNILRAILVVLLMIAGSMLASADDYRSYKTGQVWQMQTGDYAGHLVVISHVEIHPVAGHAIHISIPGPISNSEGKTQSVLPHFPFSAEGLDKTDLKLVDQMESVPEIWKEGHGLWNDAVMSGKAGIFTVPVSETIDLIFAMVPNTPQQR